MTSNSASAISVVAIAACLAGVPAAAQDRDDGEIIVTGTLIRGASEDAPAPVDLISAEELANQGSPSVMDLAKRLPASSGVIGDSSQFDPRSQYNQGSASVNLRGLGPQRTLVLLNGRRLVPSGAGNVPLVDVNMIPMSALERIEVLKDGAAATYGSDAIAGVVNFITRTDQLGFLASGDYRYIPGSNGDYGAAVSWGGDVGTARVFLAGGYQRRRELRITDRDFTLRSYDENPQGGYTGGGNPGNFDFDPTLNGVAFTADEGCEALGSYRTPASAGDLCLTSYLGFTNLIEPEDHYQLFGDIAVPLGAASFRVTGLYGRTDTVLNTSPSFLPTIAPSSNAAFGGSGLFVIPQYAPALIDYCARFGAASGCAVDGSGAPVAPALAYPVRFRPLLAGGNPLFANDRGAARLPRHSDSYQATAELTVPLSGSLELTAGATFSEYDRYFTVGDSFVDLLQNALAGFGGPDCGYASPVSRAGLSASELAAVAGTNGCSYFNPFSTGVPGNAITGAANPDFAGEGSPVGLDLTPGAGLVNDVATIGDFYNVWDRTADTRQWVADLVISGGSGVTLPGGEVQFAAGAQYRANRYARTYEGGNDLDLFPCPGSALDPVASCASETGALGFIGSGRNVSVFNEVGALFAELQLPVTKGVQAQIAARYENYGGAVGSTFDPQFRVRAELTDWLALRGGIGTTFRGPPPEAIAADLVILTFIGGAFRAVDILANPNLAPESATTWNVGVLIDRGGLRANLDYWSYDFEGPIESEPISGMVSAMLVASGTANCGNPAFAGLEARFTFSGAVCSASNVQRVATYNFNSADVATSGVDFQASYDLRAGNGWVQAGFSGSHVIEYSVGDVVVEGVAVQPAYDAAGLLNYQTTSYPIPEWKGQAWVQGEFGSHLLRAQVNHVAGYTDQRDIFGTLAAGQEIGSYTTMDATWRWRLDAGTTLALSLLNIFDENPPFARLDQNYDPFTADPLGFTAKLGLSQRF